ncbi:MFS transporter [Saccharibacillus alkalitolerans]|uniref:MFS transporter n=1 Tax=Saccharibacillus alkalitolerans TaxID=2705290 RepID=A0ABX0F4F4_9BACL|nr:MFS transporter [Saccharibacillus alkalitolerans]NGZ74760.1 MFS transporter [Saccharibacillus alkalitolerans]
MQQERLWSRDFLTISFSSFFIFINFYILAVTLPEYALTHLGGSPDGIGLVTTVFVIAAVLFRPLTGKWLDEIDRKKLLVFSVVMFAGCSFFYLWVPSYSLLLVLRFIHGISFGIAATTTSTVVLDVIPKERKGEGIGYFTLFMSLAMVFGPFVGLSVSANAGYPALFVLIALFAVLACVCGIVTPSPQHERRPSELGAWNVNRFLEFRAVPIAAAGFLIAFAYGAISTFISVYAVSLGLKSTASYFFVVFAAVVLLSRPFTGRLFDRRGANVLVYPGIALFALGMIALSQAGSAFFFLLTAAVIGLGYGAIIPSFQTLAIQSSPAHRSGLATGTYFVLFDLGYGLGSYALGLVASSAGYSVMYLTGGIAALLALAAYYGLHHRSQRRKAPGRVQTEVQARKASI